MSAIAPALTRDHLDWPFFDAADSEWAAKLDAFAASPALAAVDHSDTDNACRTLVRELGKAGLLDAAVSLTGGDGISSRKLCIARETLAYHDGLADFAFAMQGLGTGAISLVGSDELKQAVLPKVASGEWISAFALSEKLAGSDVAAMSCAARPDGDHYVLDGEKTWISNGGIADVYTVFARSGEAPGTRGISAFVVLPTIRDSPFPNASMWWPRIRWQRSGSTIAAFRQAVVWALRAKVLKSPCARSIFSALPWQRQHWVLRDARQPRRLTMPAAAQCSAVHLAICN